MFFYLLIIKQGRKIIVGLRWRASNVMQPCNNWRRGFRFTALECPSRSGRGHPWCPWCHATCLVPI